MAMVKGRFIPDVEAVRAQMRVELRKLSEAALAEEAARFAQRRPSVMKDPELLGKVNAIYDKANAKFEAQLTAVWRLRQHANQQAAQAADQMYLEWSRQPLAALTTAVDEVIAKARRK